MQRCTYSVRHMRTQNTVGAYTTGGVWWGIFTSDQLKSGVLHLLVCDLNTRKQRKVHVFGKTDIEKGQKTTLFGYTVENTDLSNHRPC